MGRKLDPLREKRGPGRKARKQRGAEVELARFLPHEEESGRRKLSSHARRRAAKRRLGAASGPAGRKAPGGGRQPAAKEQVSPQKETQPKRAAGQAPQRKSGFSDGNAKWLTPAKAKKNSSKGNNVELSSDGEVEEGSWEMEEEEDEDESGEEMVDDYGASSSEEEELLPIEKAALKQKSDRGGLSEDDSEEEEEEEEEEEAGGGLEAALRAARRAAAPSVREFRYNKKRVRLVSRGPELLEDAKCILYWMSRDQRVQDNWAFLYAQRLALKQELPLRVCFCLVPKFLGATIRHYGFMLRGLQEVSKECTELNIPFHLLLGYAKDVLPPFVVQQGVGGLVTDFCPLRVPRQWVEDVRERLPEDVPFVQVDAHNIVPCWVTSPKQEYSARTIRGKIHSQLPEFLTEFPPVVRHPHPPSCPAEPIAWDACYSSLQVDRSVAEVEWATPGTSAGLAVLQSFIAERLKSFSTQRNDPNKAALSNLSPWFHFGQVSTQRAILEVQKHRRAHKESVEAFVEEAVVRRELADNFCYYNENYDSLQGAYDWAQTTLRLHAKDKRPFLYELQQLEQATTHDPLWNAAQLQMVREGKMHGFLRMYWAKKILEWTRSPEEALQFAIYLNDRYELDGRDPNGYVGCLWSICGIHDQGWKERDVFGKIRYMNYSGCKRKFDVDQFERRYGPRELAQ